MNYDLDTIAAERDKTLEDIDTYYNTLDDENKALYDKQKEYSDEWEAKQNEILDEQLKYNTNLIEQNKEKARKSADTENKKALNDYAAYTNPYGYQAERIAENGLSNAGVSETSKLGAYTTYQNRLSAANTALTEAITQYDNEIAAAKLENDSTKAQNALSKLQMQMEYLQTYYSTKWSNGENRLTRQTDANNTYNSNAQWQKTYEENQRQYNETLAENQRQYNESMAYQKQRDAVEDSQWEKTYNLNAYETYGGGNDNDSNTLTTAFWSGDYNSDAMTNGKVDSSKVFSNGYQPNNVNGNKLKATGNYTEVTSKTLQGTTTTTTQKVWKATVNGTTKYYVWDGSKNAYFETTETGERK